MLQTSPGQRPDDPEFLSSWSVNKGAKAANCSVVSHRCGFELTLAIDGTRVLRRQVSTSGDVVRVEGEWRRQLEALGWKASRPQAISSR
jgi:hypothetical protein